MKIEALMIAQIPPHRTKHSIDHFRFKRIIEVTYKTDEFYVETDEIAFARDTSYNSYYTETFREVIILERAETVECSEICTMPPYRLNVGGFHDVRRLFNDIISG